MDTKKSLNKNKQKLHKTVSLRFRFFTTVIVAMLAIAVFIGGVCLYEVDNYVQTQAENFVSVTCENEGARINGSLSNMEKSVKIMESYLMDFFTSGTDVEDKALQEKTLKLVVLM